MAIDTKAKRQSALSINSAAGWYVPLPDGTVHAADRAMLSWVYGGMFLGAEAILITGPMRLTFTVLKPTVSFAASKPMISFVASKPTISFTVEE